ncbi:MAG TPA: hypothetical protein VNE18_00560, partial [Rhodanobacter sp.]|nr:hypothetical protein [Rhodanobacter sp.]
FTLPPLARVGLLEAEARAQGLRFRIKHQSVADWYTARRVDEPCYAFKVLVEGQRAHSRRASAWPGGR